ncbi:glycerol-3-phosphate 1-O-acyltransferase PlsB [Psychrosphaera sp. B3R10]|uniref:glycerol-3-phosphate 1-O-acyltransferase PlsB n=1 Tax=unclassified Psychrosphaera TaxID=2641570 RepID=UPI001C08E2CD|nr:MULTISPECIES: glycerol-3-phosphate 1-O-acyltransferase PlsB [unclassified Psychrosphaera]MBU2880607.1 glycerol-3-phosphate 1-O-acyltransferase PlsB [Psychrosphaera sp. I2R16]MBU2990693.1 glycerol-3-phosphate 1-O-acyltransferase PlsB [Psychrosphaera sp. B3R10]
MSIIASVFYWLTRPFIRTKVVIDDSLDLSTLSQNQQISYVLTTDSFTDKLAFEQACREHNLASPFSKLKIQFKSFNRTFGVKPIKSIFKNEKTHMRDTLAEGQKILQQVELSQQDVLFVPVMICWGRSPGVERKATDDQNKIGIWDLVAATIQATPLRKFFIVLFSGRHNFVRISKPVSLQKMVANHGTSVDAAHKLMRVARIHFERQRLVATGPKIMARQAFFNSMLASPALKRALQDEMKTKDISLVEAKKNANKLLHEIAGDYNETYVRFFSRILTWVWNKIYNGIRVHNSDELRELAQKGHEIVYVPCHRSHMDYLLLTYVIYHQGLVPPHIAAGINLNFWPAGPIFRKAGAFFLRRSFKGNKLYSAVFREYLSQLFIKGYPVKYYTEGGRSRTGRLLPPKTGMLAMTIQAMLRGIDRPITLVPVYIGYEHVMEVNTYLKELQGKNKEKESVFAIFKALRNLKNYGHGDVNFGKPINLNEILNQTEPDWRSLITVDDVVKPKWLTPVVNHTANLVMENINDAAVINTVNLCAMALLTSENHALPRDEMDELIEFYLQLQQAVPYSDKVKLPSLTSSEVIDEAIRLEKVESENDEYGTIIRLDDTNAILMSYYRNNVVHLFAVPSVIAGIILTRRNSTKRDVVEIVSSLIPLLRDEFFMTITDLELYIDNTIEYFESHDVIQLNSDGEFLVDRQSDGYSQLNLLARIMKDTLQRYALTFNRVAQLDGVQRGELERDCLKLAKRLLKLHDLKAPEYFDKKVISGLVTCIREQKLVKIDEAGLMHLSTEGEQTANYINSLLSTEVLQSLKSLG